MAEETITKTITEPTKNPKKKKKAPTVEDTGQLKTQLEEKETEIIKLKEIADQEKENTLRAHAELENFKKRKAQEAIDFRKYANENVITELLPVLDSFDRAVEHAPKNDEATKELVDGFLLIQKQFHSSLEKLGVTKIDALNEKFDPNRHQAVGHEEQEGAEPDTVIKEYQAGYKLNERIIRPSMVVISK